MLKKTSLTKWSARIAMAAVAGGLLVGTSLATSASASVCYTRGCGGEITNDSTKGIFVTNNWCRNSTANWYVNFISCKNSAGVYVQQTWSDTSWNSYFLLLPGDTTADFDHFYDTDAYRVDPHCEVVFDAGGTNVSVYNSSSTPMWKKINNWQNLRVVKIAC